MKTINRNNTEEASLKNLKKKSKYLRKMKQKNGNLNLFEQSGEVKESLYIKSSVLHPYPESYYYEEDYV